MSSGMGTAFGMAEDEDMGQTQDSEEFLNGYHHDNLYNPEGAIGPLDWDQLKFDSTKHRPKKGEQCKIIGIGDIDQHHATFLHVQQLPEGDPHHGYHHKVLNHQYYNSAAGTFMFYTFQLYVICSHNL